MLPARPLAVLALALLSACRTEDPSRPTAAPATTTSVPRSASKDPPVLDAGERWNVLLVTLDTVRADVLQRLGARRAVAPHLEQLVSEGVLLTAAETVTPLTLPAHCSLLTGLYPGTHGVRHNARYALSPRHVTLATTLKAAGWRTGAFVAAYPLSPEYGTSQGFDTYDATFSRAEGVDSSRPASAVNAVAIPWLQQSKDPFFAWIHYFDAHDPYTPPEPWRSRFPGEPYLAEVALADAALGDVLGALHRDGRLARTLVVVAADHGEGLGEHGEAFHGLLLHGATMHVPVVLWGGPLRREAREIAFATSLVDVMPTVLGLLGVEAPAGSQGLDLSAHARGVQAAPPERPAAFGESWYGWLEFGWSPLRGVRSASHRYVEAPVPELYDLRKDPRELTNLAEASPALSADLRASLLALEAAGSREGSSAEAAQPMSAQEMEALQSLGYVSAGGGVAIDTKSIPPGPDPKSMMGALQAYDRARALLDGGDPAGALPLFDEAIALDPRNAQFRGRRAKALAYLGRVQEAEGEWTALVAEDPGNVHASWDLSILYELTGRTRDAIAALRRMQAAQPDYVGLAERLAGLRALLGETAPAVAELDAPGATGERLLAAARLARRAGDAQRAADLMSRAAQATPPAQPPPWLAAAVTAESAGRGAASLADVQAHVHAHPGDVEAAADLCHAALRLDVRETAARACVALARMPGHDPADQAAAVRALLRAGRDDEARAHSEALLRANPGWWWVHRAWAEELARRGDRDGARRAAAAWLQADPGSKEAAAAAR